MPRSPFPLPASALAFALATTAVTVVPAHAGGPVGPPPADHVLLLSVDGMHQADLAWYVSHRPGSSLARLVAGGVEFAHAQTPVPSDSFPGMVAQVTGGNPSSTGVYYDDSFDRALLPAGTKPGTCAGAGPGAEVTYFEQADKDPHALDAGQGLAGLPASILSMTPQPRAVMDESQLPVDPATCRPVYPHSYLRVNTVFEVARAAGLRTAWADKHPAYDILEGPSGAGVQDLFTPEINSDAPTPGSPVDWTKVNSLTQRYDGFKVAAVLNEIKGFDHSGTTRVGTPAIFGMNFQTVSTAEKLPSSDGQAGGYLADGTTPGPLLAGALDFVDRQVGTLVAALDVAHLTARTAIVLSAKHGQSPRTPAALTRIPDGPIIDALDAAWEQATGSGTPLVAFAIDDDAMLLWLNDRSPQATLFATEFLLTRSGIGNDIAGNPKPYTRSGLEAVYPGAAAAAYFRAQPGDSRVPDLFGPAQYGVVYTGGKKKIAEHGGADPDDRDVPLVLSGPPVSHAGGFVRPEALAPFPVETTQIAPTILKLLGLDPNQLQAVRIEHTSALLLG